MITIDNYAFDETLYYDRNSHLWARVESPARVRIGLDQLAQQSAGTVVYLKLLPAGKRARKGRAFGSIEAGKYVGPLRAPVSGSIEEVNADVLATPQLVNRDPYGRGWFIVVEPDSLEKDLQNLVHGADALRAWIDKDIAEYREKGLLGDEG